MTLPSHSAGSPDPAGSTSPRGAGLVVVVSGPGGVGKGTVCALLSERHPDLWLSRSWTTRAQRPGESDNAYNFVSRQAFQTHIDDGGFLEWAEFLGNLYGTPLPSAPPDTDVILEIDVQGARQVLEVIADPVLIFLEAPSPEEQQRRLTYRGDPPDKVAARLAKAAEEANAGTELGAQKVVNHDVERTAEEIYAIICAARA